MPYADLNGLRIAYDVFGAGEPIVLVMGIGSQRVMWHDHFCEGLAQRGFQVIRFDSRDIGESSWLDHLGTPSVQQSVARYLLGKPVGAPYDLKDMAGDIVGILRTLGHDSAHVVGISMGGMVAQAMAIHHPERVRTLTSMMSTPGNRRFWLMKPLAILKLLGRNPQGREAYIEDLQRLFKFLNGPHMEFDEQGFRELAATSYDRGVHPRGFLRHLTAVLASGNRTAGLQALTVPTLVIHGSADPLIPVAAGKATARAVPGAVFKRIDGMGHSMPRQVWPDLIEAISAHALPGGAAARAL